MRIAAAQTSPAWGNPKATTDIVTDWIGKAAAESVQLVAFGETFLSGYAFWVASTDGARFNAPDQKEAYGYYLDAAVDIGGPEVAQVTEAVRDLGVFTYLGITERSKSGGTVYATLVAFDPKRGVVSAHRKTMPTYEERLVWGTGDGHGLRVHSTHGVRVGGLNCWENWTPLARHSLYSQGIDLHVAVWPGGVALTEDITRFIAKEGRCFVLSAGATLTLDAISDDFPLRDEVASSDGWLYDGGSAIAAPDGTWIVEPVSRTAPIVLFALDRHGVFTLSEGEGLSALGLASGEAVGRSIFELFRNAPQLVSAVRRALAGEAFTTSVEIDSLHFDTRFTPIWNDKRVSGIIGVANDITDRKVASERLEQLVRSKDEFVASVSHELRTPSTVVVGFAQELRSNLSGLSREDLHSFVELIAEQSMEVADLVEDLLVAARVDIDKVAVALEPLDVRDQIDTVLSAWREERAGRVSVDCDNVKAFADPVRLRQILRNLLTNAQRYGGEQIDVSVSHVGEQVLIRVRDDGAGIPARDREKIFEPYHRAHRFEGQPASVGLGLTVSRQLARLMGGDLNYTYADGHSVFMLSLPGLE